MNASEDRTSATIQINADNKVVKAGETVAVEFTSTEDLYGFQFTLNHTGLELVNLTSDIATDDNFGFAKEGAITASWNAVQLEKLAGQVLFTAEFVATQTVELSQALSINSRYTAAEAYNAEGVANVALAFEGAVAGIELYQNTPNPFEGATKIGFALPEAANATITVKDINGAVVSEIKGAFAKGYNSVDVAVETSGVLYYTLKSGDFSVTKKMIKL